MPSVFRGQDNFDTAGGNAVKAWVNFNGTGTVAIRASYNVTSITDNGAGDYTVNFTTALPDANYSIVGNARDLGAVYVFGAPLTDVPAASSIRCRVNTLAGGISDAVYVNVAIFR
jgi:hypothetical protein